MRAESTMLSATLLLVATLAAGTVLAYMVANIRGLRDDLVPCLPQATCLGDRVVVVNLCGREFNITFYPPGQHTIVTKSGRLSVDSFTLKPDDLIIVYNVTALIFDGRYVVPACK